MDSIKKDLLLKIGKNLRKLRKENNYSIIEVVDLLYLYYNITINEKTIRRIEKGVTEPKISTIIALSKLYNTSTDNIFFNIE